MKSMLKNVFIFLIVILTAAFQSPVPVEKEAHHHLKFENKYVRVFDAVVDPGDETLFHLHSNDYVFVTFGNITVKAQALDQQPADLILKDGEVRYTKAPITHRVINQSSATFHALAVEILASSGVKEEGAPLKGTPGHSIVLENDRVRVERLILEPGQSTGIHTHTLMSLGVAVTAAKVAYESPGQSPQVAEFQPGVFNWHGEKRTHSLKNVGTTRFEAVEIEWK